MSIGKERGAADESLGHQKSRADNKCELLE
jgi:hypothetical protein